MKEREKTEPRRRQDWMPFAAAKAARPDGSEAATSAENGNRC